MSQKVESRAVGVSIQDITLSFGTTPVLEDVNLVIEPGEFFTFLGPSGSGKSTLLRLIAGFGPVPSTGRVLIGDSDVTQLAPWERNVGLVFQNYALWPHMTVRRNVAFGLEERKVPANEIRQRVDAALELVGLLQFAERRPSQLSGGQQQRVALARTVVVEPQILLLDEPLSNLDANLRIQMRREIHELQRKLGLTTIFVTHDQEEANTISDRMAVLNEGTIQQVGSPMELYDEPVNRFVASFLGTANLVDGTLVRSNNEAYFSTTDGIRIPVADGELQTGAALFALLRPQCLSISAVDAPAPASSARLEGEVVHREFLGALLRYSVRVGEHTLVVDDAHQSGRGLFSLEERVSLHLDRDQVRVLAS
jgi:iron(III) transport system ATP-binding protein